MSNWTTEELKVIGKAEELHLAPQREDGTAGKFVTIWVVRVNNDLYVRSWRGQQSRWYRQAQAHLAGRIRAGKIEKDVLFVEEDDPAINAQVDQAYRQKYRRYLSYAEAMASPPARTTTLKLIPRETDTAGNA